MVMIGDSDDFFIEGIIARSQADWAVPHITEVGRVAGLPSLHKLADQVQNHYYY